jgi:hypothetical protein
MREMIYLWLFGSLLVLIPKKRGKGFLKQPIYHNYTPESEAITVAANCDVFGLDGHLEFECGTDITTYQETREKFLSKISPVLERIYECKLREAKNRDEFYCLHPINMVGPNYN